MQIVSSGNILHEMSYPVSGKNYKNIINLSSAELAQGVVKVNCFDDKRIVMILTFFLLLLVSGRVRGF